MARANDLKTRLPGYLGLLLLLLGVVLLGVASQESRYETGVARFKARVVAKGLRALRTSTVYGVTYRLELGGRAIEREGDAGSRKAWDAIRIGDDVDVECIGDSANETRLSVERLVSSRVYRGIAIGLGLGGAALLVLRLRRARNPASAASG